MRRRREGAALASTHSALCRAEAASAASLPGRDRQSSRTDPGLPAGAMPVTTRTPALGACGCLYRHKPSLEHFPSPYFLHLPGNPGTVPLCSSVVEHVFVCLALIKAATCAVHAHLQMDHSKAASTLLA